MPAKLEFKTAGEAEFWAASTTFLCSCRDTGIPEGCQDEEVLSKRGGGREEACLCRIRA